jgi:hypothetical protein
VLVVHLVLAVLMLFHGFVPDRAAAATARQASAAGQNDENESFRRIVVEKTAPGQYVVKGEARMMAGGNVRYDVTDGQKELLSSLVTASRGANWGMFEINLNLPGERKNGLMMILFAENEATGQRIHPLKIPLP